MKLLEMLQIIITQFLCRVVSNDIESVWIDCFRLKKLVLCTKIIHCHFHHLKFNNLKI